MPLFNKEHYVEHAIQSVLDQKFSDFELLVVNDGSSDSSLTIVESFIDPRIRIVSQENQGVAAARNRGVSESIADLIAFIDADDVWFERHLEILADAAKRYPDAGMFSNNFTNAENYVEIDSGKTGFRVSEQYVCDSLNGWPQIWTSSVMLRRTILCATRGFPVGESHGEDLAVWVRASLMAPVVFSSYVGAYYRQSVDGLASKLVEDRDGLMKVIDELLEEDAYPSSTKICLVAMKTNIALAHAMTAFGYGRKDIAKKFLLFAKGTEYFRMKFHVLQIVGLLPGWLSRIVLKSYQSLRQAT